MQVINNKLTDNSSIKFGKSYDDSVKALKLLLNLCNEDELKNLGNQITDSYLLFTILKNNPFIKRYSKTYLPLLESLASNINEFSKFNKMLRTREVYTKATIKLDDEQINIDIDEDKNDNGYLLNDELKKYNLFEKILLKDEQKEFANDLEAERKKNIEIYNNFKYSMDVSSIVQKKKNILAQTIIDSDNLSQGQIELYDKINREYSNLMVLEREIVAIEMVSDALINKLFVLKNTTVELYRKFKDEMTSLLSKQIKKRVELCNKLNLDLDTYEGLLNNGNFINKANDDKEILSKQCLNFYNKYVIEQASDINIAKLSFVDYLKKFTSNDELINYAKQKESDLVSLYAEYLIYKFSLTDKKYVMPFDVYAINQIDSEEKKKIA